MGMVKLPEKELATAFAAADYILIVQKRTDGKLDIRRATPEQVAKVVGDTLEIQKIKENQNNVKLTATADAQGVVTLSLGGRTAWNTCFAQSMSGLTAYCTSLLMEKYRNGRKKKPRMPPYCKRARRRMPRKPDRKSKN